MIPDRFAANVAWLFTELPWHDRFKAAREAGFARVEFPWPDDPVATADAARAAGVAVAMLNMPAGDLAAGERGWPNDPGRVREWRSALHAAFELADATGCRVINVLAGTALPGVSDAAQLQCLEANLRHALAEARARGVTLVTELLNREENPDYLLVTVDDAEPLLERLAPRGWRLQLDTYHLGLTDHDVAGAIRRSGRHIGHVQLADVPGRHEPGTGELDWTAIAAALDEVGYRATIGLEYRPEVGLDWIDGLGGTLGAT
jgi:hydroxypyruvate isomerase